VAFAEWLPWLLFGLLAGALLDRWDRRRVMWVVDAGRFGLPAPFLVAGMLVPAMGLLALRSINRRTIRQALAEVGRTTQRTDRRATPGDRRRRRGEAGPRVLRGGAPGRYQ
jgi:MFS family permease